MTAVDAHDETLDKSLAYGERSELSFFRQGANTDITEKRSGASVYKLLRYTYMRAILCIHYMQTLLDESFLKQT